MDQEQLEKVIYSEEVSEFVHTASQYCIFLENTVNFAKRDFVLKARELLPLLYYQLIKLPEQEAHTEEPNEKFVSEQDWDTIYTHILKKLGEQDSYLEVFSPAMQETEEPVVASLAENFADMYQDLKDFISLYNVGDEVMMNDAIWECKLNFEQYWGQRLVNALRAIHHLSTGDTDLTDEEDKEENQQEQSSSPEEERNTDDWLISKKIRDHHQND